MIHGPRLPLFLKIAAERDLPLPNEERCLIRARIYPANGKPVPWSLVETSQGQETDCVSRLVVFPGNLACAPPGYPALGHLNGLHPFQEGGPFLLSRSAVPSFPPPVRVSLLVPASSRRQSSLLVLDTALEEFTHFSRTTIAATPFPRHTTPSTRCFVDFPFFRLPSQVDLDQPPPLLRQFEDSNIHSSAHRTICSFDTK